MPITTITLTEQRLSGSQLADLSTAGCIRCTYKKQRQRTEIFHGDFLRSITVNSTPKHGRKSQGGQWEESP